jgi:hypothetical protein
MDDSTTQDMSAGGAGLSRLAEDASPAWLVAATADGRWAVGISAATARAAMGITCPACGSGYAVTRDGRLECCGLVVGLPEGRTGAGLWWSADGGPDWPGLTGAIRAMRDGIVAGYMDAVAADPDARELLDYAEAVISGELSVNQLEQHNRRPDSRVHDHRVEVMPEMDVDGDPAWSADPELGRDDVLAAVALLEALVRDDIEAVRVLLETVPPAALAGGLLYASHLLLLRLEQLGEPQQDTLATLRQMVTDPQAGGQE